MWVDLISLNTTFLSKGFLVAVSLTFFWWAWYIILLFFFMGDLYSCFAFLLVIIWFLHYWILFLVFFLLYQGFGNSLCWYFIRIMTDKFGAAMALVKSDIGGNVTVRHLFPLVPLVIIFRFRTRNLNQYVRTHSLHSVM